MKKNRMAVAVLLVCVMLLSIAVTAFAAGYTPVDPDDQGKSGIVGGDTLALSEDTVWANLTARWGVRVIFQDGDEWNNTELQNELLPVTDGGSANTTAPGAPAHDGWMFTGWERVDENTGSSTLNEDGTVTGINGPGPIVFRATYIRDGGITGDPGTVLIPFEKKWTGGSEEVRPESIMVKLYKYLGSTFDASTATLVETRTLTAADNWSCVFDISNEALYSGSSYSSSTAYRWAVVEEAVPGYTEAAHTDPSVIFNPPEVAGGGWTRITPCNELNITTSGNDKSIVCAKKGREAIVWSVEPLSQAERTIIMNSAQSGINGASGVQSFYFLSGFGATSAFGLTVTETQIKFSNPSDWSFFAIGTYNKSSAQTNAGEITNNYTPEAATFALPVTKVVEGSPATAASFEFILTAITNNAPMPDGNGATLTLSGAGSGSFGDITYTAPGAWEYSVRETAANATGYIYDDTVYLVTVTVTDTNGVLGAVATIKDATGASVDAVVFTNQYSVGDLTVSKTIRGNAADATKEFTFTVTLSDTTISGTYGDMTFENGVATFTLKGGESKTASGLPNGVGYTVEEADYSADGYVTTKEGDVGSIVGNETSAATFTNTRNANGSLTISKTVAGNDADSAKEFTFTVTLSDTTISGTYGDVTFENGVATFTLKGGESKVIDGLPNGTGYIVEETDYSNDGYVTTKTGNTGTIDENSPAIASFTNTRNTYGDLTVSKTVSGNAASSTMEFVFTVTLSDTSISGTYGDMTFENGVAAFTLKGGESKKAEGLPNGVGYTVSENDYSSDGYVTTKTGDIGTIVGDETQTAAFTNTRNAEGSLTVTKALEGNDADTSKEFTFTVTLSDTTISGTYGDVDFENGVATFTLKGGESKVIEGLPNGTEYVVEEADYRNDGYVTEKTGDTGTIDENAPAVAAFTNTKNTYGNLTVSKTVSGDAADTTKAFTFTVTLSDTSISGEHGDMTFENGIATFTLKDGESKTASSLPNGMGYTVKEADYSSDGYVTTKAGDTGEIVGGETATAAFTNTKNSTPPEDPDDPPVTPQTGSLTISKTVTGTAGEKDKLFTFTVTLGAEGTYSYTGSKSGTIANGGTVQLKHGESITISGIPEGTSYSVVESDNSGYEVTKTGDTGTIAADTTSTASFTNKKDAAPITPPDKPGDPGTPKTGDDSNMALWIGLMLASVIGIGVCFFLFRKNRRGGKHVRTFMLLLLVGVMAFSGFGATTAFAAESDGTGYTYGQYNMTYLPGTADTVTNMPANETGLTPGSDSPYTVSSTVPVREGFEFIDWALTWGTMEAPATPVDYSSALTVSKTAASATGAELDRSFTITLEAKVNINADDPTGLFVENLTVTDTIEDEFALNGVTAEILDSTGSVVSSGAVSAGGATVTHNFGNVQHGQTARLTLEVTAQPDFIGSNGVYTNVGESSWTYKHTDPEAASAEEYSVTCGDKPQVNVRVIPITVTVDNATQRMGLPVHFTIRFTDPAGDPIPNSKYDQTRGTWSVPTAKILMTEDADENWYALPGETLATPTVNTREPFDGVAWFTWTTLTNMPAGNGIDRHYSEYPVPVEITFTADGGPENSCTSYGQGTLTIVPRQSDIEIIE